MDTLAGTTGVSATLSATISANTDVQYMGQPQPISNGQHCATIDRRADSNPVRLLRTRYDYSDHHFPNPRQVPTVIVFGSNPVLLTRTP